MPDPATVDEAGLVLVVDGACFEAIVDDAGLDVGLVVAVVVFNFPAADVAIVGLVRLAEFAVVDLTEVFLGPSVVEEDVTRVLEPALLPEDTGFPVADPISATDDLRAVLEVGPAFLSVSPSPPFNAPGPPALDLALPSALDTVETFPGPALLVPSPLPPDGLAAVLEGVLLISLTDPVFDPGPTFEPAASAPWELGLNAFDSLDLIGLFPVVLEGFLTPPAAGLLFPPSPAFFPSSGVFLVLASGPHSVVASTEEATFTFATSSELRRRFGVAGVT